MKSDMISYSNYVTEIVRGWLGYRLLFTLLLVSPQYALLVYWVTYKGVTLSTGMYYLTLLPILFALILTAVLPGKSGITPKKLATFAIFSVLSYSIYDWARVPENLLFGVPFWDHFFDWGASILGTKGTIFTYKTLTAGLVSHILRGWGFAMVYYLLVRRVTLLSAFLFSWVMAVLCWIVFPVWVLTDALPPWIWWFTVWTAHTAFAVALWLAPKIYSSMYYNRKSGKMDLLSHQEMSPNYQRRWRTTLFAILSTQGFGLMIGFILFGYIIGSQPPSPYPVFGYGKPPPIVISGFGAYYWAVPAAVVGFVFLLLALKSRQVQQPQESKHAEI